MDVALLRTAAASIGVSDITQRGGEITFTFGSAFPVQAVMKICAIPRNRHRLTLHAGSEPKLVLRIKSGEDTLESALTLVEDLRIHQEEMGQK